MSRTISRLLMSLALLAISVQLYRTFLNLASFRTFALTVVSLCLEALPFLLLGSLAAALVRSYLPAGLPARVARRLGPTGIPVAALSGLVAPVCECAIVPTVRGLRERGLPLPYAITILVSVPIINPVVIASTIAAFPGRADLVAARFLGGAAVAVITGFVFFAMYGNREDVPRPRLAPGPAPDTDTGTSTSTGGEHHRHDHHHVHRHPFDTLEAHAAQPIRDVVNATLHEFLEVTRYFVVGAILSSLLQVAVPPEVFTRLSSSLVVAVLAMITLAFILSVCSEADAFLGKAFLPLMPAPAVIAFLVFGPMMDLKNAAMLRGVITGKQLVGLTALLTVLVVAMAAVLQGVWA
ncbi:MAG: permease [Alkalispirochaeta sp.]